MKYITTILIIAICFAGCESNKATINSKNTNNEEVADTIKIANDSLEYEIIILEVGFTNFLLTQPQRGYYPKSFLEMRNKLYVTEYNFRVMNPLEYDDTLYLNIIEYEPDIDYGYEVNYLLYNYFLFFQKTYNQRFSGRRN